MSGTHVAIRLPSQGTLFGEALASHPGARITCVPTGRRQGDQGPMVDLLALVEGLPDSKVASILLAWHRRYGEPAAVVGEPFAIRLPLQVDRIAPPASDLLREGDRLPVVGNVAQDGWMEQWLRCGSEAEASALADRLREAFAGAPGLVVRTAEPRQADSDCWEVLRFAGGVEPEVLA